MARAEALLYGPLGWSVIASATNGIATATKAAAAGFTHVISGLSISASAAPLAAVLVTLKDGVTVIDQFYLPAGLFAPIVIEYKRPFVCASGALAELSIPALGAAVIGSATLRGVTTQA